MKKHTGNNWLLYSVWITTFIAVVVITITCERESTSFQGIAETREIFVNSENPVEIMKINVVEGQSVIRGQQLVELSSPELTIKINHISHQFDQLKAQKGINKAEIRSQIDQLKAEKASRVSEVNNQIRLLNNQYNLNKELFAGLKSIDETGDSVRSGAGNPITLKIENLKQELALSLRPINIRIEMLQKSLKESGSPVKIQVERLEKELDLLTQENSKLNIYAQISGIIGSVNYKPGEKVAPFSPILTLHTKTPSFVKGYIYENVYNRVATGEKFRIISLTDAKNNTFGTVVGVGARMVEYPTRLQKNPNFQIWGREVVIRIPEDNPFILGEKVLISSSLERGSLFSRLKALLFPEEIHAENYIEEISEPPEPLPIIPLKTDSIEASALLWLEDIDRYLVLSDDTQDSKPVLFLMDRKNRITKETMIRGLDKINDMESLTSDKDGTLYIASSLSVNKKGELGTSRKLLIAVKREGDDFRLIQKADLYEFLKKSAKRNRKKDWAAYILEAMSQGTLDIEGMFCHDRALYLGFKAPLRSGRSVILKIDPIRDLFENKNPKGDQVSIWRTLLLKNDDSSPQERISDIFYQNSVLYIAGTSKNEGNGQRSGSLWQMDQGTGELTRMATFKGHRPEGIGAGEDEKTLLLSFDQGKGNPSQITKVRVGL